MRVIVGLMPNSWLESRTKTALQDKLKAVEGNGIGRNGAGRSNVFYFFIAYKYRSFCFRSIVMTHEVWLEMLAGIPVNKPIRILFSTTCLYLTASYVKLVLSIF